MLFNYLHSINAYACDPIIRRDRFITRVISQECVCTFSEHERVQLKCVGRESVVGTESRYGLDGARIESRWGRYFTHQSRPALGPTQRSYTMGTWSFPRVKRPGRGIEHSSSGDVKERVDLYLCSPSGSSWPFLG